jgi:GNAT superfamily N-acetyltransferase
MSSLSVSSLVLRPFTPADQDAAQQLILAGLGERWGWIDPTLNPDLNAIARDYAAGYFLVGELEGELVATGALIPEAATSLRVVRMSVRRDLRGQGIGKQVLAALLDYARQQGCTEVVLETTSTWTDAVAFYARAGFQKIDTRDGETHMLLPLR